MVEILFESVYGDEVLGVASSALSEGSAGVGVVVSCHDQHMGSEAVLVHDQWKPVFLTTRRHVLGELVLAQKVVVQVLVLAFPIVVLKWGHQHLVLAESVEVARLEVLGWLADGPAQ